MFSFRLLYVDGGELNTCIADQSQMFANTSRLGLPNLVDTHDPK